MIAAALIVLCTALAFGDHFYAQLALKDSIIKEQAGIIEYMELEIVDLEDTLKEMAS